MVWDEKLICGIKVSTVVPASVTGDHKIHPLTNMDLATKLHHITTVHFFSGDAVHGLDIHDLKEPMFQWLQLYYPLCGRIRRDDADRPFIKCNDSGVRIVEAHCTIALHDWLAATPSHHHHRLLVYYQPFVAQDLGFTPLVFLQLTKFKCGGLCVGMRWAHILGDAFSASECINMWGNILSSSSGSTPISLNNPNKTSISMNNPNNKTWASSCRSLKVLDDPLEDNWLTPNKSKMQTHSFHVTEEEVSHLLAGAKSSIGAFEVISAIVWKCLAKTGSDCYKIVTVCKKGSAVDGDVPHQVVGTVEAESASRVVDADPLDLAEMIIDKFVDETSMIGDGDSDCILYGGSNLTFVDLGDVKLCGLKMKGRSPVFADISISGVGDEGAIIVGPYGNGGGGRTVNVVLPQHQLQHLKTHLTLHLSIS